MDNRPNSNAEKIEFYYFKKNESRPIAEIYESSDFLRMLEENSITKKIIQADEKADKRGHSIWVGRLAFPPDESKYPKTKGFGDNVASLRKQNPNFNHILWMDMNDFENLTTDEKNATKEYALKNGINIIFIQDIFPANDKIELGLFNIYSIEHAEGNWAVCADALRIMILRRFVGLYYDTDIKVVKNLSDSFSKELLQIHYSIAGGIPGTNNDILFAPSSPQARTDLDVIAETMIQKHQLKFKFIDFFPHTAALLGSNLFIKEQYDEKGNYLMIPYHYLRAGRAVGIGPGTLTRMFSDQITSTIPLKYDSEKKTFQINTKNFIEDCASTWLEPNGDITFKEKHSIPEYKFPLHDGQEEKELTELLLYYHYLEERTLRFDFFHLAMENQFLQKNINIEENIFAKLVESKVDFTTVEYVAFNFIDTFKNQNLKLLDDKIFPNLRLDLYIPEFVFLIEKGDLTLIQLQSIIETRHDSQSKQILLFLNTLKKLLEGKTLSEVINEEYNRENITHLTLLQRQLKNKIPQTTFFTRPFIIFAEDYRIGNDDSSKKALLDFIKSDQSQFIRKLAQINDPDSPIKLFGATEGREPYPNAYQFLMKALQENDEALLTELANHSIINTIDDVSIVLNYIEQHKTKAIIVNYLTYLLAINPKSVEKAIRANKYAEITQLLLEDPKKSISQENALAIFAHAEKNKDANTINFLAKADCLTDESLEQIAEQFITSKFTSCIPEIISMITQNRTWTENIREDNVYISRQQQRKGALSSITMENIFAFIVEHGNVNMLNAILKSKHPVTYHSSALVSGCLSAIKADNNEVFARLLDFGNRNITRYYPLLLNTALYANNNEACRMLLESGVNLFKCDIKDANSEKRPSPMKPMVEFLFMVHDMANKFFNSTPMQTVFNDTNKILASKDYNEAEFILSHVIALLKTINKNDVPKLKKFCEEKVSLSLTTDQRDLLKIIFILREEIDKLGSILIKDDQQKSLYNQLTAFINNSNNFSEAIEKPKELTEKISSILPKQKEVLERTSLQNVMNFLKF